MVGDGKLPNYYWVSVSNDYYYSNEEGDVSWVGDVLRGFKSKGKTIAVFDTYKQAKEYVETELYLGMKSDDGITINHITIEDRISGELYQHSKTLEVELAKFYETTLEDLEFSKERVLQFI